MTKELLEIVSENSVTVIAFQAASISGFEGLEDVSRRINDCITSTYPRKLLFDFEHVRFFSSLTLGLLLDAWKRVKDYGGTVAISGINPQLHRVFKITNIEKIFRFYPDRHCAVEDMTKP